MTSRLIPLWLTASIAASSAALIVLAFQPRFDVNSSYQDILAARDDGWLAFRNPGAAVLWAAGLLCLICGGYYAGRSRWNTAWGMVAGLLSLAAGGALLRSI